MNVVCIGAASVDRKYLASSELQFGTSNPVRVRRSFGGVARNVAENLARLGALPALVSTVGNDESGVAIIEHAERAGIDTRLVLRDSKYVTGEYTAVIGSAGELIVGLSDMSAVESITAADIEPLWEQIERAQWLFVDCNVGAQALAWIVQRAAESPVKLAIDAVSEPKVCKLPDRLDGVDLFVLNEREAAVYLYEDYDVYRSLEQDARTGALLERGPANVLVTMGERGVAASDGRETQHIPAASAQAIDTTGASDALCAGVLYALLSGDDLFGGARLGTLAAALTVESAATVRPDLSVSMLDLHRGRLERMWTPR